MTERMVETRFGDTHVMVYGDPNGVPVIVFYGELSINPLAVSPLVNNLDLTKIRLFVPDPIGQIGFSSEKRIAKSDYSAWASQVVDKLGLDHVAVIGFSFGGRIALQLCAAMPNKINKLLLVSPAGIRGVSHWNRWRLTRLANQQTAAHVSDKAVGKALKIIMPVVDNNLVAAAREIFLHAKRHSLNVGHYSKKSLRKFNKPVFVIADQSDNLFQGEETVKRIKKIFPNVENTKLINQGGHCGIFKELDQSGKLCFQEATQFLTSNVNP